MHNIKINKLLYKKINAKKKDEEGMVKIKVESLEKKPKY